MQLSSYFEVQFTQEHISTEKLKVFAEDHLRKLALAGEQLIFNELLYETRTAYLQCYPNEADAAISHADQEDRRRLLFHYKQALLQEMRNLFGFINYKFHQQPEVIRLFYPAGPQAFETFHESSFETVLQQFSEALKLYRPHFLPVDIAEFELLRDTYLDHQRRGNSGWQSPLLQADQARQHLCRQLTKNLLSIAINNLGNKEAVASYFDPLLLSDN